MAYINQLDKSWLSAIGFVMVLGVAYLIFFLSERFKLLGQTDDLAFTYLYPADVGHYGQCRF